HPRDRFSSAREMLDAIAAPAYTPTPATVPSPPPSNVPYQPTTVVSPTTSPTDTSAKGMGEWQKTTLIGLIIGAFLLLGVWMTRPQSATTTSHSSSEAEAITAGPESSQGDRIASENLQTPQPNPKEFIINHYANLNRRQYQKTWRKLSPNFKTMAVSFDNYVQWWDRVSEIRVGEVQIRDRTDTDAVLDVQLQYLMNDGDVADDPKSRIYLIWDSKSQSWLFENKYEP
ncbi:serine/threonine protein kinase, partial [Phormidium sp. CCY1219]|nr:serine/threonine protein kinase [Phormidium sp. CCY1219]